MTDQSTPAHNADPDEIARFEALADRWWDPDGEMKALHDINPLRVGFIAEATPIKQARAIDVGCGAGLLAEALATHGARVTGIDLGEAPLAVGRTHAGDGGLDIDYRRMTAEAIAAEMAGQFDVVTCLEMLEHVPDPASVVAACVRLVRPGGHVYFSTINRNPKSWLLAIVGAEYALGLVPRGTHDYSRFIRPSELDGWARRGGLDLERTTGLEYNPLTRVYRLSDNVDVNYMVHYRAAGGPEAS